MDINRKSLIHRFNNLMSNGEWGIRTICGYIFWTIGNLLKALALLIFITAIIKAISSVYININIGSTWWMFGIIAHFVIILLALIWICSFFWEAFTEPDYLLGPKQLRVKRFKEKYCKPINYK